jgi:hypothetical protein
MFGLVTDALLFAFPPFGTILGSLPIIVPSPETVQRLYAQSA